MTIRCHSCPCLKHFPSVDGCIESVERCVKIYEPVYAVLAATLVLCDAYIFFTTVINEVGRASGPGSAAMHAVFGAFLLFNVLFNHAQCMFTSPGTTLGADLQELRMAMDPHWRWCSACDRPKPPLAHHCSICDKCVLKMDHHCVWMNNCVGFHNYRFFFLYVFWMWFGGAYSTVMTYRALVSRSGPNASLDDIIKSDDMAFVFLILSMSVFLGLSVLLGYHVYLVLTASGTIEAMATLGANKAQKQKRNPYDLGWVENFKEAFDAHGKFWVVTWMVPSRQKKRGSGFLPPRRPKPQPDKAVTDDGGELGV